MNNQIFINIDDTFFIKENKSIETLTKCKTFVANQRGIERAIVEKAYEKNILKVIKLTQKVHNEGVDIVIKTKFNKDYKFVNLDKSLLFYQCDAMSVLIKDKIDQFHLNNINFFPPTYLSGNLIFQKLAKGFFYRPNNLADFSPSLLTNIANVIDIFSSLNSRDIKIAKYMDELEACHIGDSLNSKILSTFILIIKRYKHENFKITLTHGDFKFEHLFILNNQLEYLIDWENVDLRSIFFDLLNFFTPWFVHRSYNYPQIKKYISKFIQNYLPHLQIFIQDKYDLYFAIFAMERYKRIDNARSIEFDINEAYKRYNFIFNKLTDGINHEY